MRYDQELGQLIAALEAALIAAPRQERQFLLEAVERYAARYPNIFFNSRNADAARVLRELFSEITEAVDARPI